MLVAYVFSFLVLSTNFVSNGHRTGDAEMRLSSMEITMRPPKAAQPDETKGFPSIVSVHDFDYKQSASFLPRVLRRKTQVRMAERFHVVDLLGGITRVGEYYTQIFVGGQAVRVQIDTGSSTLALPMAECSSCLATDLRYNMRRSTTKRARWISCTNEMCRTDMCGTYKCEVCSAKDACCSKHNPAACGFRLKYGDKSYARGALVVDDMTWGDNITAPVVFGGILEDSPHFERTFVDGILGMAYKALACNPTCVEPPFQQMVAAGKVADSFSICMNGVGGKLVLGGMDPQLAASQVNYVPLALSKVPSYYTVNITNVLDIGGRKMMVPYLQSAIVDSGTTLLVVRVVVFELITKHLKRHYCHVRGLCDPLHSWFKPAACAALTDADIAKLPNIRFTLKPNVIIELRPQDYMIPYHKSGRELKCVGIMAMAKLSHGTDAIFGNTVMQRYVTHYDRERKRMGFALAKKGCGKPPKCSDMSTCWECAKEESCSFNFASGKCASNIQGIGLIPYPRCTGENCLCWLGPQTGLLFGIIAGFAGTFVLFALAIFLVALYGRGRAGEGNEYSLANRDAGEEEEALFAAEGDHHDGKNTQQHRTS